MNKKLKVSYIFAITLCTVCLVAFQNCSQTSSDLGGTAEVGSNNPPGGGGNPTGCALNPNTLNCLLNDGIFKFIITDAAGNVLFHGTNNSVSLSATGNYRFYVVGVDSVASSLPVTDKWIACVDVASSDNNGCMAAPLPTFVLTQPAHCEQTPTKPFRPILCDSNWQAVTQGNTKYLVRYNWLQDADGNQMIPSGVTVYSYIKANSPASTSTLRIVLTTTP